MKLLLTEKDVGLGTLILVNPDHALQADFSREQVPATQEFPQILIREDAARALNCAFQALSCYDAIVPVSGFRSMAEQIGIFEDSLRENGEEFTRKYVALPGCSEHQSGLAIDLGERLEEIDFICPSFPYDGICGQFRQVLLDHGFVERYPAGKESITRIGHEPWHFRYVGVPHARIMDSKKLTLEEYVDLLRKEQSISWENATVTFLPAQPEKTPVEIPEGVGWDISGNNVDGFILTTWRDDHEQ